jgi:hypothetical protein
MHQIQVQTGTKTGTRKPLKKRGVFQLGRPQQPIDLRLSHRSILNRCPGLIDIRIKID